MTEVFFYALQRRNLEQVLPELLQKTLARGWRAVVRAGSAERVEALTDHLWTFEGESFLPHGSSRDGQGSRQPIWLTEGAENPNLAAVLFLVDGAGTERFDGFARICDLFDGRDADAVAQARARMAKAKAAGMSPVYWSQDEAGRWRQAET
jgi:DNA polymerase-3 subunit chi